MLNFLLSEMKTKQWRECYVQKASRTFDTDIFFLSFFLYYGLLANGKILDLKWIHRINTVSNRYFNRVHCIWYIQGIQSDRGKKSSKLFSPSCKCKENWLYYICMVEYCRWHIDHLFSNQWIEAAATASTRKAHQTMRKSYSFMHKSDRKGKIERER